MIVNPPSDDTLDLAPVIDGQPVSDELGQPRLTRELDLHGDHEIRAKMNPHFPCIPDDFAHFNFAARAKTGRDIAYAYDRWIYPSEMPFRTRALCVRWMASNVQLRKGGKPRLYVK